MNIEKLYEAACRAAHNAVYQLYPDSTDEQLEKLYRSVLNNPEKFEALPLLGDIGVILQMAKEELAKSQGGKATPAIKRIMKNGSQERYHGAFLDSAGRQIICDGYRLVRLNTPIEALPQVAPFCQSDELMSYDMDALRELPKPLVGELKAEIVRHKATRNDKTSKSRFDFGEELPAVDTQYLLDMLCVFPDATIMAYPGRLCAPLFFFSKAGDGCLLPVRK